MTGRYIAELEHQINLCTDRIDEYNIGIGIERERLWRLVGRLNEERQRQNNQVYDGIVAYWNEVEDES